VPHAHLDVVRQAVVRLVHDLVHRDRPDSLAGIGGLVIGQLPLQVGQPHVQLLGRACVQGREGADDAGLALRSHQRGAAGDEHRRSDDG
jgi:hypothetical protein